MTIVVTGGSGFIGTALTRALLAKEHTVIVIDKRGPSLTHQNLFYIPCDLETSVLPFNVLERTDAVIHLAGRNIAGKWNESAKRKIRDSRVLTTRHLIESIKQTTNKPPIFISASAVSYYGEGFDRDLDERSAKGDMFLSTVAEEWEREAMKAEQFGCRTVIIRTAPVVGRGGFLKPFLRAARFYIAFKLSKEDYWMPWIHINDIVRIYLFALETGTLQGVVNAAAPLPIHHSDFMNAFVKETKSVLIGRVPFSRLLFGDFMQEITMSQKVVPQRLLDKGFPFAYANIREALHDVVREKNQ